MGRTSIVFIVFLVIIAFPFLFINSNKGEKGEDIPLVVVNGSPISKLDYHNKIQEASILNINENELVFQKQVLEDMINAELLFQEAKRRFGDGVSRQEGITNILRIEVQQKLELSNNSSIIEKKNAELLRYREYVKSLKDSATIIYALGELNR